MDENGYIIGTGDRARLNQYHEGAALVIKNKKKLFIYPENRNHLVGVKPGINLPIESNKQVIGAVGITGNPDEVGPFGEVIKMTVEMMLQQEFLLKELDLERQAKDNFVHDLISGRIGTDLDLFIARGQIVGYDITLPRIALLINIFRFEKTVRRSIEEHSCKREGEIKLQRLKNDVLNTIRHLFIAQPQDIVAYVGGDRFVVIKTIINYDNTEETRRESVQTAQRIKDAIFNERKFHSSVGIGEFHKGITGIVRSYQEACQALEIGNMVNRGFGIHHINFLGISRLLVEISTETRNDFLNYVFYRNNKELEIKPSYIKTLFAFFENHLNITETAKAIFIHRNTLLYRLERIEALTGLNPRKFDQALQLYIALKIKNLQKI